MSERLTRKGFVAWLRSLPPDKPVPQPMKIPADGAGSFCPMACYEGGRHGNYWYGMAPEPWVAQFAVSIDLLLEHKQGPRPFPINYLNATPRDCLGLLAVVVYADIEE